MPAGSVLTLALSGRIADRFGAVRVLRVAGVLNPAALVLLGLARNLAVLMVTLAVFGALAGLLDVSMNACGARLELGYGRPIMSSLHAGYSIAGLAGAGIGGVSAWLGASPLATFAVTAAALIVGGLLAGPRVFIPAVGTARAKSTPATRRASLAAASRGDLGARPARAVRAGRGGLGRRLERRLPARQPGHLAGRGRRGAGRVLGHDGGGPGGGRPAGRAVRPGAAGPGERPGGRARPGGRPAGRFVPGYARWPAAAIAGFALLGAGPGRVFPQIVTAAARLDPEQAGRNIGRIAAVSYTGLLSGPVVIGAIASGVGLRDALLVPAALALLASSSPGARSPVFLLARRKLLTRE